MLRAVANKGAEQTCACAPELDNLVLRLDGGGACLLVQDTGADTPPTHGLTLEGWVRANGGAAGSQTILFLPLEHRPLFLRLHDGGWEFGQEPTRARARASGQGLERWLHVAGVCEPNGLKLYLGGRLCAAVRSRCSIRFRPGALIGAAARAKTGELHQFFSGELSRLRVWSKALSAADLGFAADAARPTSPDLLADWPLNEGCGKLACNRALDAMGSEVRTCLGNASFHSHDSRPEYAIANVG